MNKCDKCGFLHYRTDPCRVKNELTAARKGVPQIEEANPHRSEKVIGGGETRRTRAISGTQVLPVSTIPKPKRSGNRHRPGYFTEYMRQYRARKKASAEGRE